MAKAAVAAVSLGASVISFIGLTGQIPQGCQFICDCFDDINGAPKAVIYILEQLKGFEKGLRNFQYTLEKVKECTDITDISESEDKIKLAPGAYRLHQAKINIVDIKYRLNLHTTNGTCNCHHAIYAQCLDNHNNYTNHRTFERTKALTSDRAYGDFTYVIHKGVYAGLDPILTQMVKISVNTALKDLNFNNRSDIEAHTVSKHLLGNNEQLPATKGCGDSLLDVRSNPRVVQQNTTKSTINAWLATIIIRSTTAILQQRFCDDASDLEEPLVTSKTTHKIDICPKHLIQARYLVFIDQQRRGSIFGCSDMRLRCYNKVPFNAPIAKACRMGELSMVRRLVAEGKATPHDMTSSNERRTISSLLFHVWE
ncbi:uncharacterized protein Bfra_003561 [Botrytis fragariae]|uniref:Uncharacterized protein n=1 Tax=Botrytis fragariae TaxID=1964551 RepID=A0A8H6AWJ7_9HELO|nr:uncharacterized protein Bfra_003561 [Botrytis fragariae]KAF5875108.1 hypothetical protein Bfra_003561 [Botrytis fragariae]